MMDGIDALRAIKDGKTVRFRDTAFRLGRVGLEERTINGWRTTNKTPMYFIAFDGFEIADAEPEFNLSFVDAFASMLVGKRVSNNLYPQCVYYIDGGSVFGMEPGDSDIPSVVSISTDEQRAMWRVDGDLDSECVIDWPDGEGDD